jgi:hypothetical protein
VDDGTRRPGCGRSGKGAGQAAGAFEPGDEELEELGAADFSDEAALSGADVFSAGAAFSAGLPDAAPSLAPVEDDEEERLSVR